MILDYERKEHSDAILYASINVFYLKMIQYEKYQLPVDFVKIHNLIDRKLETLLRKGYNKSFDSLNILYESSLISVHMDKKYLPPKLMDEFLFDITCLSQLDKELSNEIGREIKHKNLI